jgi:acetyl-CoA C-acetyltransferase/acetyl-CoA acyltransferase
MVVVEGVRTPFCRMGTSLAEMTADDLGAVAVKALLAKTGLDPATIDEVIMGCCGQPAEAANVGRVLALRGGIPNHVPAITVHRNCASGCESITLAYEKMCAGVGDTFIVGGCEAMSQFPLYFQRSAQMKFGELGKAKTLPQKLGAMASFRPADFTPRITLIMGLTDPVSGMGMGMTAEVVGRENGITREMADDMALKSHLNALAARDRLREEITPVYAPPKFAAVRDDNGPREGQSIQALTKLKPVFERKTGTVTAGNASQITDGAVAILVMSEEKAAALGYEPLGVLVGYAYAGCDPARMGLGPVYAVAKAEKRCGLKLADADLIELNEAFAAQALACIRLAQDEAFCKKELDHDGPLGEFPEEITNVNGGAIALGHPVGCSGARISLTLLKELKRRGLKRGLATLCVGGGQGAALWFERP